MSCLRIASRAARAQDSFRFRVSYDLSLGADTAPLFFLPTCNIILLLSNIILHYRPGGGRFTNLSTPFSHVYLSGTYPRCVRQLVGHRGHRPRTLPLPFRLLGGVPRILQLSCLVDRTARPVSRLVDAPVGRDEAEQRSLERELRSDEESPLHIPLEVFMTAYYERYERVKGMASFLSDDRAVGPEDAAAAVEAQLAGDADYRAQAFAFIEGFVCFQQSFSRLGIVRTSSALRSAYRKGSFSTVVFSPRHSLRKRGSAHLA